MDGFEQPVGPMQPSPRGRGRLAAGLLVAAVIVGGAAAAWLPTSGPSPSPVASTGLASPSTPSATSSSSSATSGVMPPPGDSVPPPPTPSLQPTVPPTYPPDAFVDRPEWRVSLVGAAAKDQAVALIVDPERRVVGAAPAAMRFFTAGFTGGVLPGADDHSVDVYWRSSTCGWWATVTLDPDGAITVSTSPADMVCTPEPAMRGLELRFATKVSPESFSLLIGPERRYPPDEMPVGVAFADARHGLVAMTNGGDTTIAETVDGGGTWRLAHLGDGRPTGVALAGGTAWTAISCDPAVWDHCAPGVYRRQGGVWTRVHAMDPGAMAVQDDVVAVFDQPLTENALPTGIDISRDGGATWRTIPVPCTVGHPTGIALDGSLAVVCQASASSDARSDKALWSAPYDWLTTWTQRLLPESGTKDAISMAPGGTGVLWGTATPPFLTSGGGGTWTANPIADGRARIVQAGDAQPSGIVSLLVFDTNRDGTLLLQTVDGGASWWELTSFRELPCCGG